MKKRSLKFRLFLLMMVTVLVAALAGCGDDDDEKPEATATPEQKPFRVAAVAPSAQDDLAFSQSMYDALQRVQQEMGAENFEFEFQAGTFVVEDATIAMREWAASGNYDLIIAHGSQYGDVVKTLATEFPQVSFAWGTNVDTFGLNNVFAYEAAAAEGGYINGVLAARLTKSNKIGVIGPLEVGDAKLYVDGFVAGVNATNPDAEVAVTYTGSFTDVPLATQAAEAQLADGADILTGTSQMVVGPIAAAIEHGDVLWFGTQSNQSAPSGEIGVAFQVYHWEVILTEMIAMVEGGTLGGTSFTLNLENGGLVIEYGPSYQLPEELTALVDSTIQDIIAGKVNVLPGE